MIVEEWSSTAIAIRLSIGLDGRGSTGERGAELKRNIQVLPKERCNCGQLSCSQELADLEWGCALPVLNRRRFVEWDHWCCDTIRENRRVSASPVSKWPEPIEGDVRHVDFRALEGKIDLVSGGPPCQPFSLGGKHRAHADHRDMWGEAVRVVRETKPSAFVFEKCKGSDAFHLRNVSSLYRPTTFRIRT